MKRFISLFGHSYHSKDLIQLIKHFEVKYPEKPFLNHKGEIMTATASNRSKELYLGFKGANYAYPAGFGEPKSISPLREEEIILMEITIMSNILEGVHGLKIGDSQEDVLRKLNTKPKEKSTSEPSSMPGSVKRHNWIFWMDDYKVQTSFLDDFKLDFIRVREFEKSEKLKIKLNATIKEQKKNLSPENLKKIEAAGDLSFLNRWSIDSKDELKKNELTEFLKNYLALISEHTAKKSASKIYTETSKLVKSINKLNRNTGFIESTERADLCAFIEKVVQSTGFRIPEGLDITEEYRMW
ncbi:hypothetical protein [Croceimicrobium hydrocarbonivorans]|uniref:Uncharacterized protein n=1 Tax=Croceimicrobium hydrocarbonivorans TaxID=2761580 RepID=A0A7H0VHF4_9FLAO|nr:hypothetical protein [Croceimicrobium hydrocarbonivorans]QNR25152.1 hypothetical protein H4K34_04755 [Croceimicrobium hydrocarbonivorans]